MVQHRFVIPIPDSASLNGSYNPWLQAPVQGGQAKVILQQQPIVDYIGALGHMFDHNTKQWYILNKDTCVYEKEDRSDVERCLMKSLIATRPNTQQNITQQFFSSVMNMIELTYCSAELSRKLNESTTLDRYKDIKGMYISPNGVLDIKTKELLPNCRYLFDPERTLYFDYHQMSHDEIMTHPAKQIYDNIFTNERNEKYYLWFIGQTLFSNRPAKAILIIIGISNSGKSALMKPVKEILGDRGIDLDVELFNGQFGSSLIKGGRLAIFNEADGDSTTDAKKLTSTLKRMTGGEKMVFNSKNQNMTVGQNTANVILMCNRYPDLYMPDAGLIERLRVIRLENDQNKIYVTESLHELICKDENINWLFNAAAEMWNEYGEDGNKILAKELQTSDKKDMLETSSFMKWAFHFAEPSIPVDIEITIDDIKEALKGRNRKEVYDDYRRFIDTCDEFGEQRPLSNQKFYDLVQGAFKVSVRKSNGYYIFI